MSNLLVKGIKKNPAILALMLLGFFFLYTNSVSMADLEKLEKSIKESNEKAERKQDTLDEKIDKMAVNIATIVAEWRGFARESSNGRRESFNHVIRNWPPDANPPYLLGWVGTPPENGWDSCVVANFVEVGSKRAICRCYYTDSTGSVNITELE